MDTYSNPTDHWESSGDPEYPTTPDPGTEDNQGEEEKKPVTLTPRAQAAKASRARLAAEFKRLEAAQKVVQNICEAQLKISALKKEINRHIIQLSDMGYSHKDIAEFTDINLKDVAAVVRKKS